MIRTPSGYVDLCVEGTHKPPKLPEGYRLDLAGDPDAPALQRPNDTVVARFSVGGMTYEAVEREALEDLLLRTSREPRGGNSVRSKDPEGHDAPINFRERRTDEVRRIPLLRG